MYYNNWFWWGTDTICSLVSLPLSRCSTHVSARSEYEVVIIS